MMDNILTVSNDDLGRLTPEEAVEIFSQLLWAEATSIGLPKNQINIPGAIDVPDGGIDAEVRNAQVIGGQGIIKSGLTCYQIKTGNFNLNQDSYIKDILLREKKLSESSSDTSPSVGDSTKVKPRKKNANAEIPDLKPKIKTCLDNGGTLVVVLFGWDNPEQTDGQLIDKFMAVLNGINPKYQKNQIEIWPQNKLLSFISNYPSLALRVNRRAIARFDTHQTWSNQDQMRPAFMPGESQIKVIEDIRRELRRGNPGTHIRVLGEPGVGKTRVVLEAIRESDLAPLVIYTQAECFSDSDLMAQLLMGTFRAILVIDECDPNHFAYFTNKLKHQCKKVQIISIYNDWEQASEVMYANILPLSNSLISQIILSYGVPKDKADQHANLCSGSPRIAHMIGLNLQRHPEDISKVPSSVRVWDRYIAGDKDINSEEVRQIHQVLRYLALFKRFGYGPYLASEAESIINLIQSKNANFSQDRFHEIIAELRDKRILQGENTLYITPKFFHIKLWGEWWDTYGRYFDINTLNLSPQLFDWFFEMFEYALTSEVATRKAKELLGNSGPFQANHELLKSRLGARFFYYLAKSEPQAALNCLKVTLGTWSMSELLSFTEGRRDIVRALEYLVSWRTLFVESAQLLLSLAEAENEAWANNASGTFADLFKISTDPRFSKTEASPEERSSILKETLASTSKEKRLLGLKACEKALSGQVGGMIVVSQNPLQKEPDLWKPKTWEELFEGYRQVWNLLFSKVDIMPSDESTQAIKILIGATREVARYESLNEMVFQTLVVLSKNNSVDKRLIVEAVIHFLHYNAPGMPNELRKKWDLFQNSLFENNFHSRLERHIGMDILEDKVDENGEYKHEETIKKLANEASENPEIVLSELNWLLSMDSPHVYSFGYEFGQRDANFVILPEIIHRLKAAEPSNNLYFAGGYLRALYEKEPDQWKVLLGQFVIDEKTKTIIPELIYRASALSEQSAQWILNLLLERAIQPMQLTYFAYGHATRQLNEITVIKWIEILLDHKTIQASSVALPIFDNYYLDKAGPKKMPAELTFNLLTSPGHVEITNPVYNDQMAGYHWRIICQAFVHEQPQYAIKLARFILDHFSNSKSFIGRLRDDGQSTLTLIAKLYPHGMWNCVIDYLTFPIDGRDFEIQQWLRGSDNWGEETEGALSLMKPEDVWAWVDQNIEQRAYFLAGCSPKLLFITENKICWAREVLIRYGTRDDVRNSMIANFSTEGWTGPASFHFQRKIDFLRTFLSKESNKIVTSWIEKYIGDLQETLEHARIQEERRGY